MFVEPSILIYPCLLLTALSWIGLRAAFGVLSTVGWSSTDLVVVHHVLPGILGLGVAGVLFWVTDCWCWRKRTDD